MNDFPSQLRSQPSLIPRGRSLSAIGVYGMNADDSRLHDFLAPKVDSVSINSRNASTLLSHEHQLAGTPAGTSPADSVGSSDFGDSARHRQDYVASRTPEKTECIPPADRKSIISGRKNFQQAVSAVKDLRVEDRAGGLDYIFAEFLKSGRDPLTNLNFQLSRSFKSAEGFHSATSLAFIDALGELPLGRAEFSFNSIANAYRTHGMSSHSPMGRSAMSKLMVQSTRLNLDANSGELGALIDLFKTSSSNYLHGDELFTTLANSLEDLNSLSAKTLAADQIVLHQERLPIDDRIKSVLSLLYYFKNKNYRTATATLEMIYEKLSNMKMVIISSFGLRAPEVSASGQQLRQLEMNAYLATTQLYRHLKVIS